MYNNCVFQLHFVEHGLKLHFYVRVHIRFSYFRAREVMTLILHDIKNDEDYVYIYFCFASWALLVLSCHM